MDYETMTAWDITKKFLAGWAAALLLLVVCSLIRHWDFITASLAEHARGAFSAALPCVILLYFIFHQIRSIFR